MVGTISFILSYNKTKYSLSSMVNLAIESFTSLSVEPLKIPLFMGIGFGIVDILSFIGLLTVYTIIKYNIK